MTALVRPAPGLLAGGLHKFAEVLERVGAHERIVGHDEGWDSCHADLMGLLELLQYLVAIASLV